MPTAIRRFAGDQSGATAIEYGLIGALVSVAIVVGVGALGSNLKIMYDALAAKVIGAG
jgi:pilus assembly protein Flp/PilA